MGLFGASPDEKVKKGLGLEKQGRDEEARFLFDEALAQAARLSPPQREAAEAGSRRVRTRMIVQRLAEADGLWRIADLEAARDRCQTALDLARDDLDSSAIHEKLRQIDTPKRPLASHGPIQDSLPPDLLPAPETAVPAPPPEAPEHQLDPEALFEIQMHSVDEETAGFFRGLGVGFRDAYLALVLGDGPGAVAAFARLDPGVVADPRVRLERAHALLLAGDAKAALDDVDHLLAGGIDPSSPDLARCRFLRVEALRALARPEDAVRAARDFEELVGEGSPAAAAILGWTLIEAGRFEEALALLDLALRREPGAEELQVPAAQAVALLGRVDDAILRLEAVIQSRFQRSLQREVEVEFPVEAGRRLLDLYLETGVRDERLGSLIHHLLDHDPARGETYRGLLVRR